MIPETTHILLTAVKFNTIIIAENHVVSVNVCITVDSAIAVKISGTLKCIVPAMQIAADKVIITDIYAAREKDTGLVTANDLADKIMEDLWK